MQWQDSPHNQKSTIQGIPFPMWSFTVSVPTFSALSQMCLPPDAPRWQGFQGQARVTWQSSSILLFLTVDTSSVEYTQFLLANLIHLELYIPMPDQVTAARQPLTPLHQHKSLISTHMCWKHNTSTVIICLKWEHFCPITLYTCLCRAYTP